MVVRSGECDCLVRLNKHPKTANVPGLGLWSRLRGCIGLEEIDRTYVDYVAQGKGPGALLKIFKAHLCVLKKLFWLNSVFVPSGLEMVP